MAAIAFEGVEKRYPDGFHAIKSLDLVIEDGEFLVLVGPSGCGKSTALRMIAGLEDITDGTVRINGDIVNDLAPRDRDVAMVFQSYALYPHLSVRRNIGFGLRMRGMARHEIDRAVTEAAAMLELTPHLDRKPNQLSGGQKQRVAMGRAIVRRPMAFLMDEPLSNLDAKLRVSMRAEITRIQKKTRITTVYVTHDQVEAMTMGDRVAVLDGGKLLQIGAPRTLYERPANLFVASFIGSPSMNVFEAEIVSEGETIALALRNQTISLLSGPAAARLQSQIGRKVVLGIRPEHLVANPEGLATLGAEITLVEHLGAAQLVHLVTGAVAPKLHAAADDDEIARARGESLAILPVELPLREGETLRLGVAEHHLYLFDFETGAALDKLH